MLNYQVLTVSLVVFLFSSLIQLPRCEAEAAPAPPERLRIFTSDVDDFRLSQAEIKPDGRTIVLRFLAGKRGAWSTPIVNPTLLRTMKLVASDGSVVRWLPQEFGVAPKVVVEGPTATVTFTLSDYLVSSQLPIIISVPEAVISDGDRRTALGLQSVDLQGDQQFKDGVRIQSFAGSVQEPAASSGIAWSNSAEVVHEFVSGTVVPLPPGGSSRPLLVYDFGFDQQDIPAGTSIVGIGVRMLVRHSGSQGQDVFLKNLTLTKNGKPIGVMKQGIRIPGSNPDGLGKLVGELEIGTRGGSRGLVDLWGTTLSAADLIGPDVGVQFAAENKSNETLNVHVHSLQLVAQLYGVPKVRYGGLTYGTTNFMADNWYSLHAANSSVGNARPDQTVYRWTVKHPAGAAGAMNVIDPRSGAATEGQEIDMYQAQVAPYAAFYLPVEGTYTLRCDLIGGSGQLLARGDDIVLTVAKNTRTPIYYGTGGSDSADGLTKNTRKATVAAAVALATSAYQGKNVELIGVDNDTVQFGSLSFKNWENAVFRSDGSGTKGVNLQMVPHSGSGIHFSNSKQVTFKGVQFSQQEPLGGPAIFGELAAITSFVDVENPTVVKAMLETGGGARGLMVLRTKLKFRNYGMGYYTPPIFHFGVTSSGDSCCFGHTRNGGATKSASASIRRSTPQGSKVGSAFYYGRYSSPRGQSHRMIVPWTWFVGIQLNGTISTSGAAGAYRPIGIHTYRVERSVVSQIRPTTRMTVASSILTGSDMTFDQPIEFDLIHSTLLGTTLRTAPTIFGAEGHRQQVRIVNSALQGDFTPYTRAFKIDWNFTEAVKVGFLDRSDNFLEFVNTNFGRSPEDDYSRYPEIGIRRLDGATVEYAHGSREGSAPPNPNTKLLIDQPWNFNSTQTMVTEGDFTAASKWRMRSDPRTLQQATPVVGALYDFHGAERNSNTPRWSVGAAE